MYTTKINCNLQVSNTNSFIAKSELNCKQGKMGVEYKFYASHCNKYKGCKPFDPSLFLLFFLYIMFRHYKKNTVDHAVFRDVILKHFRVPFINMFK